MDDVPWLDDEAIKEILSSTPVHLRATVKNGTPALGSGAVYPISLDEIVLKQSDVAKLRPLPPHWRYMYGMDVGWNKTAVVFLAQDPDTGIIYVTDEYYQGNREPEVHAARIKQKGGDWMHGVIDPASRGRSQNDGTQLLRIYRALGLKVRIADNSVESGIFNVWSRLSAGTLKFFPNCSSLQNEYLLYRRDENNKVIKQNDHALDALRYAINTFQHATTVPVKQPTKPARSKYNV
jgi:hypothetical protein